MTAATLAILAGGEGSRMGRPKGDLRIGGKPILVHLLDRSQWDGPTLLVTAPGRDRPEGWERFTREVTDPTGGEGPLRGVLTALENAGTEIVLITTCDMPRVESRQLTWLVDALASRRMAALVMVTRGGRREPFPLAVRSTALPRLAAHLAGGGRAMRSVADLPGAVTLHAPPDWPDEVWTNLNTPADVAAFDRPSS